jgi:hypothetical protein
MTESLDHCRKNKGMGIALCQVMHILFSGQLKKIHQDQGKTVLAIKQPTNRNLVFESV